MTSDEPTHYLISLLYRDIILNLPKLGLNLNNIFSFGVEYLLLYPKIQVTYPPLFHLITGLLSFSLFGPSVFAGRFVSSIFSFGSFVMLFLIVRKIFDEKIAFLTVVLFALSPYFIVYSGYFMKDTTAFFFVFLSLYIFLLALEKPTYKIFIILAFTSLLAAMSERPAALFTVFVIVYSIIKKIDLKKILIFIITFGILIAPYTFLMYKSGGIDITYHVVQTYGVEQGEPSLLSPYNWIYYLNAYFPIAIEMIFLTSFAYYLYKKDKNWKMLLLFFLIFYMGLSIPQNKEPRFAQYILFPTFITFSYHTFSFGKKIRKTYIYPMISLLLFSYLFLSILNPITTDFLRDKPIEETASYLYTNLPDGANIGMISENGKFYSASFMVYLSEMDKNKKIQFFRPCVFNEMSSEEIVEFSRENNIYFMIATNPEFPEFEKNIEKIEESGDFGLIHTIDETKIYRIKDYQYRYIEKRKNYICIIKKWISEDTTIENFDL